MNFALQVKLAGLWVTARGPTGTNIELNTGFFYLLLFPTCVQAVLT